MNRKALIGIVLMVLGTALFLPGLSPQANDLVAPVLVLAAILLTGGTYLLGTSSGGRPV